ncbi:CDP-glycerol glycerophosphotransferase family protein [Neptunicella sp.]|uniref:CDP-glycerol glycerophosphotransferase family protein n=1 Tax=Neptunicella sp. TaxID=2125986 RepID=UPI003F691193
MKKYLFYISQNYSFQILRPIQDEIIKRGDQVAWFIEGNDVNRDYFRENELLLGSIDEVVRFNPYAVFVPGNVVPAFIPGLKVSLHHGFMGFKTRAKDNVNYFFVIRDCFDLYCTYGPTTTEPYKVLAKQLGHFRVQETGFSKMDPYFNTSKSSNPDKQRPIILFSSTFSPRMTQAPALIDTIKQLSLSREWEWKVTFHPKMDKSVVNAYKAIQHDNLTFIETDDLTPYMLEADLMLGDNSSMLIDFLLLDKPVVTFKNEHPMPHLLNVIEKEKLHETMQYALGKPEELMVKIRDYAQQTHPYTDGKSSVRVLDAVDAFYEDQTPLLPKPQNRIRNLKLRKKLGYWKL